MYSNRIIGQQIKKWRIDQYSDKIKRLVEACIDKKRSEIKILQQQAGLVQDIKRNEPFQN
jgi:hypothetical protein